MKRTTLTSMPRVLFAAGAVAASAVAATAAFAQPPEGGPPRGPGGPGGPGGRPPVPPIVAALDADKNGEISAEEIEKAVAALKTLDKNGDGKLTQEELRPERPPGEGGPGRFDPQGMLDRVFENAGDDGKLSKEEAPERMRDSFDRADGDQDGQLTREEVTTYFRERMREGGGQRGPRDGDEGPRGPRDGDREPREEGDAPAPGATPEL